MPIRHSPGAAAILAVGTGWVVLASWHPDTTWHSGPLLVAAAGPWVIATLDEGAVGRVPAQGRLVRAGIAGFVAAVLVTLALESRDLLRGPTLWGIDRVTVEAVLVAGAGAVCGVVIGALRTRRRRQTGQPGDTDSDMAGMATRKSGSIGRQ